MITLFWLIPLTFLLGPAGAIPYAFANGLSTVETAIVVSAIHLALVPVWFWILELVRYRFHYENRIIHKLTESLWIRSQRLRSGIEINMREFERTVGQRGFGIGVIGFTFLFGVSWAALAAILLNIKKSTIIMSIAIGAVVSSLFWTFAFAGLVGFLPSPWMLYLIGMVVTFAIIGYKKLHERKLLREMSKFLKKLGIDMG